MSDKVKHRRGSVYPVWQRFYNDDLKCSDARIVGYRLELPGGKAGPVRRTVAEARADKSDTRTPQKG